MQMNCIINEILRGRMRLCQGRGELFIAIYLQQDRTRPTGGVL